MSLWGWVGDAAAAGVVASSGGSLGAENVSKDRDPPPTPLEAVRYWRETHGRKLQAEDGRFATRVKISEIKRCCTLVS